MLFRAMLALAGLFTASSQDAVGSRGCTSSTCVFSNSYLRFGTGTEPSVNTWGLFQQPWYYSGIANAWYKLTFSNYPLDTAIGTGNSSAHWSGSTIVNLQSLTPSYSVNDYSNFIVHSSDTTKTAGHGSITATRRFSISGQTIIFQNTFSLGQNDSFVKITNVMINNSTAPVQNAYIWVGTRDDFVGMTDVNTKTRGNLIGGAFTAITSPSQSSYAIMITNTDEGVLFYSETPGVMTAYALCCSFSNAYDVNPLTLAPMTPSPTDGSYAAVLPLGTIAVNASASITWYYAAGIISSLGAVAQAVSVAQAADAGPLPTPTTAFIPTMTAIAVPTFSRYPAPTRTGYMTNSSVATFTAYPVPTAYPTVTAYPTATATPTVTASPTPTSTVSVSQTSSTTPTVHIFYIPASPQTIYLVHTGSDYTPFLYALIPITLLILCGCMLCCIGAYIYKRRVLDKKEVEAEAEVEAEQEQETEAETGTGTEAVSAETISVDPDVVHIRDVDEKKIKNVFRKPFVAYC